ALARLLDDAARLTAGRVQRAGVADVPHRAGDHVHDLVQHRRRGGVVEVDAGGGSRHRTSLRGVPGGLLTCAGRADVPWTCRAARRVPGTSVGAGQPLRRLISSVAWGRTVKRSPTTP